MLLRELFEVGTDRSVAIMFGRFNPPHFGHVAAWVEASKFPAWYIGTNQSTQGPKDPLPFSIKVEAMKKLYPEIVDHLVATQTWFTLAVMAYKQHGEGTTLRVVTDDKDMKIYLPMIQKQNGVEGPHGYYKFKNIVWAEAKRKSEASLVRKAVRENNKDDFEKYALDGQPDIIVAGRSYFELVRQYLLPYMDAEEEEARKKDEREKAKAEKEKAKAEKSKSEKAKAEKSKAEKSKAEKEKPITPVKKPVKPEAPSDISANKSSPSGFEKNAEKEIPFNSKKSEKEMPVKVAERRVKE